MTAAEIHARTLLWERFRILGLDLLPLTVGHVRIMEALGCMEVRDPAELAMVCWVCSMPAHRFYRFHNSRIGKVRLWLWAKFHRDWDFKAKRDDFGDYIRCNTELPEVIRKADEREPTRVPSAQAIRVRLMSDLGVRTCEIDCYPFLQALWDLSTIEVLKGQATMLDKTASEIEEEINRIDWARVQKVGEALFNKRQNGSPDPDKQ